MIELVTEEMHGSDSGRLLKTPIVSAPNGSWGTAIGSALETHDSGHYRYVRGRLQRNREGITVRELSDNYNRDLKNHVKGAISASTTS